MIERGWYALRKLLAEYEFETVLDLGAGDGKHAKAFAEAGKTVVAIDTKSPPDLSGWSTEAGVLCTWWTRDWNGGDLMLEGERYDVVWMCHVLEHERNPGRLLDDVRKCIAEPDGLLAITVPPAKRELVGGHVSVWNGGILLYHLALAGFDCSRARVLQRAYDLSCIVPPASTALPELENNAGDIKRLADAGFLPAWFDDNVDGNITDYQWGEIA